MIPFAGHLQIILIYQYIIRPSSKMAWASSSQVQTNLRFIGICLNLAGKNPGTPTPHPPHYESPGVARRAQHMSMLEDY